VDGAPQRPAQKKIKKNKKVKKSKKSSLIARGSEEWTELLSVLLKKKI
jgi:hypothetical protein